MEELFRIDAMLVMLYITTSASAWYILGLLGAIMWENLAQGSSLQRMIEHEKPVFISTGPMIIVATLICAFCIIVVENICKPVIRWVTNIMLTVKSYRNHRKSIMQEEIKRRKEEWDS